MVRTRYNGRMSRLTIQLPTPAGRVSLSVILLLLPSFHSLSRMLGLI